jgi:hypothetical protein
VRVNWHAQIAEMFDDLLDVALECGRRKAAAPEAAETRAPPCPAKGRGVKPSGLTVEWPLALRIHLLVRAAFWSRREGAQGASGRPAKLRFSRSGAARGRKWIGRWPHPAAKWPGLHRLGAIGRHLRRSACVMQGIPSTPAPWGEPASGIGL